MARLSFIVAAAAAAGCAAFTAPARTPMALSTPSAYIKPRRAESCPLRHRRHASSTAWLCSLSPRLTELVDCAQVHAKTDEYQGRPLRRPGRLRRALAAAERAPRQLRRPGRQEQHLGRRAEDGGRPGRGRVWRRPDRHRRRFSRQQGRVGKRAPALVWQ